MGVDTSDDGPCAQAVNGLRDPKVVQFAPRGPAADTLSMSHGHERGLVRVCFHMQSGDICAFFDPEEVVRFAEGLFYESLLARRADDATPTNIVSLPDHG